MKQNNTALSAKDKKTIVEYLNGTEILKGQEDNDTVPDEVKKLFSKVQKNIPKYINAQAVTLLSAKGRIPFEPGCFDLLVIDEASQCDIASAIPLLYRAKRVVVIGDLMQLPHVSTMARGRDMQLLKDSGVDDLSWLYSVSPLFKLATSRVGGPGVVTLREHHRSHADIIDFSNNSSTVTFIFLVVLLIISIAASISAALRSAIFVFAISSACARVIAATFVVYIT